MARNHQSWEEDVARSEPSDRTDPAGAFILTSGPQNSEGIYVHGFRDVCNNFLQHGKKVT